MECHHAGLTDDLKTCPQQTTLCYLRCEGQVLMLYRNKKPCDPNAGKWVGVGGKFEAGEDACACALREIAEETGWQLEASQLDFRGIVHFVNDVVPSEDMYLFTAELFAPLPAVPQTIEGTFAWIAAEDVPALPLWAGDSIFLRRLAEGAHDINLTLVYHGDELREVQG